MIPDHTVSRGQHRPPAFLRRQENQATTRAVRMPGQDLTAPVPGPDMRMQERGHKILIRRELPRQSGRQIPVPAQQRTGSPCRRHGDELAVPHAERAAVTAPDGRLAASRS